MENKTEDEIRKRWEQEAKDKADKDEAAQQRPKKRARAIEYQTVGVGLLDHLTLDETAVDLTTTNGRSTAKGRGVAMKKPGRAAAARARGKVTEMAEDEDDVIEVD
jgi:hypothetical protein